MHTHYTPHHTTPPDGVGRGFRAPTPSRPQVARMHRRGCIPFHRPIVFPSITPMSSLSSMLHSLSLSPINNSIPLRLSDVYCLPYSQPCRLPSSISSLSTLHYSSQLIHCRRFQTIDAPVNAAAFKFHSHFTLHFQTLSASPASIRLRFSSASLLRATASSTSSPTAYWSTSPTPPPRAASTMI